MRPRWLQSGDRGFHRGGLERQECKDFPLYGCLDPALKPRLQAVGGKPARGAHERGNMLIHADMVDFATLGGFTDHPACTMAPRRLQPRHRDLLGRAQRRALQPLCDRAGRGQRPAAFIEPGHRHDLFEPVREFGRAAVLPRGRVGDFTFRRERAQRLRKRNHHEAMKHVGGLRANALGDLFAVARVAHRVDMADDQQAAPAHILGHGAPLADLAALPCLGGDRAPQRAVDKGIGGGLWRQPPHGRVGDADRIDDFVVAQLGERHADFGQRRARDQLLKGRAGQPVASAVSADGIKRGLVGVAEQRGAAIARDNACR